MQKNDKKKSKHTRQQKRKQKRNRKIQNATRHIKELSDKYCTSDEECGICLEEGRVHSSLLLCGHTFCVECMGQLRHSVKLCPICREPLVQTANDVCSKACDFVTELQSQPDKATQTWDGTTAIFARLCVHDPKNVHSWLGYSLCLLHRDNPEGALASLEAALESACLHDMHKVEIYFMKARAFREQQNFRESVNMLRQILAIRPGWDVHYLLGIDLLAAGAYKAAIPYLRMCLADDNVESYINLSRALSLSGDLQAAIQCIRSSIQKIPESAALYQRIAKLDRTPCPSH